jgi:putative transcriptional regulator
MSKVFDTLMTGLDEVEAFLAGETAGYKVNLPAKVDVKSIRKRLKMTQARFADTFGFSLDASSTGKADAAPLSLRREPS